MSAIEGPQPIEIKTKLGKASLRPDQIEKIWTLTGLGKTPREVAKELYIHPETVRKYLQNLKGSEDPRIHHAMMTVRAARARAYSEYLAAKAISVLETISGTQLGKASVQQRGVLAGILVDKSNVMSERASKLEGFVQESAARGARAPDRMNVDLLLDSIKGKVERLTFLQVDLPQGIKEKIEAVEAEVVDYREVKREYRANKRKELESGEAASTGPSSGRRRRGRPPGSRTGRGDFIRKDTLKEPKPSGVIHAESSAASFGGIPLFPAGDERTGVGAEAQVTNTAGTEATSGMPIEEVQPATAPPPISEDTNGNS